MSPPSLATFIQFQFKALAMKLRGPIHKPRFLGRGMLDRLTHLRMRLRRACCDRRCACPRLLLLLLLVPPLAAAVVAVVVAAAAAVPLLFLSFLLLLFLRLPWLVSSSLAHEHITRQILQHTTQAQEIHLEKLRKHMHCCVGITAH